MPSVAARGEYDSNVFVTADDPKRDFIATLSPAIEIVKRNERLDTSAQIRLDSYEYADNRELSAIDQTYKGNIRYRLLPNFGVAAQAGYLIDSRPDRDLQTTGLVTTGLRRERFNTGLSTDYQLSELTALSLSYAYGKEIYEKRYSDTLSHEVKAGLIRDLGKYFPAVKGMVNIGYIKYDIGGFPTDSLMGTVGFSRSFNEIWGINAGGGLRYTETQFPVFSLQQVAPGLFQMVQETKTEDGWGWVGQASLTYKGLQSSGDLTYSRDVKPASGQSRVVERNTLALNARYRFTQELSASLNTGYYTNKTGGFASAAGAIDEQSFRISPRVRYEFSRDTALEASHDYSRIDNQIADTQTERHLVSVRLTIQHALLE
ncbi:MAG: outer membrane beta-barrel protein [Pseudomonadota bacterium]